jgi:hypothetical protein
MLKVHKHGESEDKAQRILSVFSDHDCTDSYLCLLSGGKKS